MKRLSIPMKTMFVLVVVGLLVACAPGQEPPSPEEIQAAIDTAVAQTMEAEGRIATSVAMTVAAQDAETAAAAAALPTATPVPPEPLPTLTPILPTATPFTADSSSGGSGGSGGSSGGGSSGAGDYACGVVGKSPRDNTEFRRTNTFDVKFTIVNTGTKTWDAGKDVSLLGNPGATLSIPTGFVVELPKMEPGDKFTVGPFDAQAPDDPGHYVLDFKVEGGICYPYVAFNVVR